MTQAESILLLLLRYLYGHDSWLALASLSRFAGSFVGSFAVGFKRGFEGSFAGSFVQ